MRITPVTYFLWMTALIFSCSDPLIVPPGATDENFIPVDWTDRTHSNKAEPDYETVFAQNQVSTLEIELGSTNWKSIQSDMKSLFGYDFGIGNQPGGFPVTDPVYVPVSVKFNGKEWYKVGFRLKGNSTLGTSWRNGIYKLPFRLNFDRFEDQYPQINNQRFFGFKELSMSPGAIDPSLIREKVGADIFRMAGIPSARTTYYKVYINFGDGLQYCGVYTMVEVVDDTMIKDQFGNDSGNIYKPESNFTGFVMTKFEKKNNKAAADYSDVVRLINILHSDLRLDNPVQWRAELEEVFDADHFMKWLAVNTTMQNWDTYGRMPHNYYLYNTPGKGLTWIPWDNNESLSNRGSSPVTIGLETVDNSWPLIRYLMDDPVYAARYRIHMQAFLADVFTESKMNALFESNYNLIAPYVLGPQATERNKYSHLLNLEAFIQAQTTLKQHVINRIQTVNSYLQKD
ncbi:MAG: CotH kinase family protein [Cyclobacteriaceae bacterium]|nr:CotH kinase family protein [Cyclobacteriaceae bacterium]